MYLLIPVLAGAALMGMLFVGLFSGGASNSTSQAMAEELAVQCGAAAPTTTVATTTTATATTTDTATDTSTTTGTTEQTAATTTSAVELISCREWCEANGLTPPITSVATTGNASTSAAAPTTTTTTATTWADRENVGTSGWCLVTPDGSVPTSNGTWTAGNIISDELFYASQSMSLLQITEFINKVGAGCVGPWCLKTLTVDTVDQPADEFCDGYTGKAGETAAAVIHQVSISCGISPKVMLVTLDKESGGVSGKTKTASSWEAAWGWHCPDTGPGGTANCDPAYGGFFNQAFGMAKQWQRYKVNPDQYTYQAGQTADILWNVAESGGGGAPVAIANTATASLYNYTPYQPNAAALAAPLGVEGDECSAYGNKNFWLIYRKHFGDTDNGTGGGVHVITDGVDVQLPPQAGITGTITAPNRTVATAMAAGLAELGTSYAWGGGNATGPTLGIRGGCYGLCITYQDWNVTGYDCSGLMLYSWAQAGLSAPRNSQAQARQGLVLPYSQRLPGDMIGTPTHIAMYLGVFNGTDYWLEAPQSGGHVQVAPVRSGHYDFVSRIWEGQP